MSRYYFRSTPVRYFVLFCLLLFAAVFTVEKINGRFWLNDFKVFYLAARALLQDERVYGVAFGLDTGFYKYSPFTLLFFLPFTLASFETASVIYFFLVAFCSIATILMLVDLFREYFFPTQQIHFALLFFILLSVLNHLVRELHLGNTNLLLLFLLLLSLRFTLDAKPVRSGALLAVIVLTKPYFIVCLFPLLYLKKKITLVSFCISLLFFVIGWGIVLGIPESVALYSEWFSAMKEHSGYLSSSHTIFSLLNYYAGVQISPAFGLAGLCSAAILLFGYFYFREKKGTNKKSKLELQPMIMFFFLLIALVPSLLITDTEHFLFSLPLIVFLIMKVSSAKKAAWTALLVFVLIMYGGNSSDLVGRTLAAKFETMGLLGISNLVLITLAFYFLFDKKQITQGAEFN